MRNVRSSVERLEGIREVNFDLNTGEGTAVFEPGKTVAPEEIWQAIKRSGFTPVQVETGGETYTGPNE